MFLTQCIRRNVQINRNGLATICGDRQRSWVQLADRVARLAGAFRRLGVQDNDRVGVLALNSDRYLEYYFACWWSATVAVPVNVRWSSAEIAYSLVDSDTHILLVDDAFLPMIEDIKAQTPCLKQLIYMGDGETPAGMLNYETILAEAEPIADMGRGGEDLAGIFYTGGTTGFSKGVMLPHRALWSCGVSYIGHLGLNRTTRYLHAAPMFHLADFAASYSSTIANAVHIFTPRFDAFEVMKLIDEQKVNYTLLIPTMITMLLDEHEKHPSYDLSSLALVLFGGAATPQADKERAIEKMPHTKWLQGYGMTECAPLGSVQEPRDWDEGGKEAMLENSSGKAGLCSEIRIVDEEDNEVAPGVVGELTMRGGNIMQGYWNKPEETAKALRNGWLYTGDAAYMTEEGDVVIADRLKDMIITGGENVYSGEVENVIINHPAVNSCAVFGIPGGEWGEAVHAVVVPKEGAVVSGEEIVAYCRSKIANYKCPRSVDIRLEPLPLSGAGKILKRDLRQPFWEGVNK